VQKKNRENFAHKNSAYHTMIYSRTSEQRTLWDRGLCPLFRVCPLFRGCL